MPSAKLEASFIGEDLNGDHVIAADELVCQGHQLPAPNSATDVYQVANFSYRNENEYSIDVGFSRYYDPGQGSQGWAYGRSASWSPTAHSWGWSNDGDGFEEWTGTSETVAHVLSSVPEPTTFAMLGLGLSVIGLARRRLKATAR